jgi:polyisoprenoid-binding protein YceI
MVISKVRGHFARFAGAIDLDDAALERSVIEGTIETASIDTNEPKRDGHLRSADFFDAEKHPKITFHSKRLEPAGEDRYRVVGDLAMHGVTREVVLDAEITGRGKDPWGGERIGVTARTRLNRKEFGLGWNQVLETGGVLVGENVDVDLEIEAVKAA